MRPRCACVSRKPDRSTPCCSPGAIRCWSNRRWQRRRFPVGANPIRQPRQPEAIGAVMEVTKWLKPSISVSRIGDSASVQAATRVNVEQASKRKMCRPIRLPYRGRLKQLGELSEEYAQLLHRGIGGGMYTRKAHETREAPWRGQR